MEAKLINLINTSEPCNSEIYYQTIESYVRHRFKNIKSLTSTEINAIIEGLNRYVDELNSLFQDKIYKVKFIATRTLMSGQMQDKVLVYEEEDGHWDKLKTLSPNIILLNKVGLID